MDVAAFSFSLRKRGSRACKSCSPVPLQVLAVPVAVFLLEFLSLKRRVYRGDWTPGLQEALVRRGLES